MKSLIVKANKKELKVEDLWNLANNHTSDVITKKVEKEWNKVAKKYNFKIFSKIFFI